MSDVFREVDEDLRRERLKQVWNRYSILLIGAAVLVVVLVAIFVWLDSRRESAAELQGDRYYAALDLAKTDPVAGAAAFAAITADGEGGYPALAALSAASALAEAGDIDGAVAAFDRMAADTTVDAALRDVARMRAGMLLVDTAPLEDVQARLEPLSVEGASYRNLALEFMAVAALRVGDLDKAIGWLTSIAGDANVSQSALDRATKLFGLVMSRRGLTGNVATPPAGAAGGVDLRVGADANPAFEVPTVPGVDLRAPAVETPLVPTTPTRPDLGLPPPINFGAQF